MKIKTISTLIALALLGVNLPARAQVVARYTFDGRVPVGEVSLRLNSQDDPFPGEDYEPDSKQGESGPRLVNIGGGGKAGYYRSYYNHTGTEGAEGREVLELRNHHSHFHDIYQTPEGEGPLPAAGSFTWEAVVRVDEFDGANHWGILVDASRGAGRVSGWTTEGPDKAIVTRLWMRPVDGDKTSFLLCFTLSTDDDKRAVQLTTELKYEQWYHLAAVYNDESQQARIYVNGQEVAVADVHSVTNRATGFALAGYGPEVFRIDHRLALNRAFIDAIAFSKGALGPEQFSLKPEPLE